MIAIDRSETLRQTRGADGSRCRSTPSDRSLIGSNGQARPRCRALLRHYRHGGEIDRRREGAAARRGRAGAGGFVPQLPPPPDAGGRAAGLRREGRGRIGRMTEIAGVGIDLDEVRGRPFYRSRAAEAEDL